MPPSIREDLLPGTRKSQELTKLIRDCLNLSYRTIALNFPQWDIVERSYRAFRPADDEDLESLEKNGVQKIVVPIQFATIQTMLTFMMEVFNAYKPVLRVRGADPSTVSRAQVMEISLDYDYRGNRGYFTMQQWFMNAFRYGYGIIKNTWGTKQILKRSFMPGPSSRLIIEGKEFSAPGAMKYADNWITTFEGNKWVIADNRAFFPDPRVPLSRFQEGTFCAYRDQIHDNELYKLERQGLFFNTTRIRAGKTFGSTRDSELGNVSHERDIYGQTPGQAFARELTIAKKNRMHVNEEIIIELIPRDYELGDADEPQFWLFNLIDGETICRAEPSPFYGFPYSVIETYPDELAMMSQGVMSLTQPLANHIDFLFNSHMANVRKSINDMFVFDPSRIDIDDILDPGAGKFIRLLPLAYGTDPASALKQLAVTDVTQGHMTDTKMLLEIWERVTGASNYMFGQISSGRRTAFELQGVFRQAGARMKMMADLFSSEGVAPLTEQMALLRQENMSMSQFMAIAGKSAASMGVYAQDIIQGYLKVSPEMLAGVFMYPAEEGVLPQDRVNAAELFQEVFQTVAQFPWLASSFDPIAIFKEMIRQKGLHNIDEFMATGIRAKAVVLPDEVVHEMMIKGSIQPFNITGNMQESGRAEGRRGPVDKGVKEDEETLTLAGAMNGAGASYN